MGASAVPHGALEDFSKWLSAQSRVAARSDWIWHQQAAEWSLLLAIELEGSPSVHIPPTTLWHLVLRPEGLSAEVKVYPDRQEGITATFPHQTYNGVGDARKQWRSGHPCLDLPLARLGRVAWNDEPSQILPRLQWHLTRLLKWIDDAAADELVQPGDPIELPDLRDRLIEGVIGFCETPAGLQRMAEEQTSWGYARLAPVTGALRTWALTERLDQANNLLERFPWSSAIGDSHDAAPAVWIRLTELPVLAPWRRPDTWRELNAILAVQGIDLPAVLVNVGIRYRSGRKRHQPHRLLLCFPMAESFGGEPVRFHWLAVGEIPLAQRLAKRDGFRPTEPNYRRWDSEIVQSSAELRWQRTLNWAPDQLRTRGEADSAVRSKCFLIIGAGSLGAAIADKLLRLGVTEMRIMDAQRFEVGNLSRHVLTMVDAGHNKAIALARHLNLSMPDAQVEGVAANFPPANAESRAIVDSCHVIIDCTASDAVLDAMASYPWSCEKNFISLSMAWRAAGLLAFSASEASFPALDAKSRFNGAPTPAVDFADARVEGIGCWLPVFPAGADDVHLWASIGCKFIRQSLSERGRHFAYFRQSGAGEVDRV